MEIEFDPAKRQRTLRDRGLDLAEAALVFGGVTITLQDTRKDNSERRLITFGRLHRRLVVMVWTPRGDRSRIISLRKANAREEAAVAGRV